MEKVTLRSMKLFDKIINFNEGVNYITAPNAGGKTTLFQMIQYTLGLKKFPSIKNLIGYEDFYIECSFGNKYIRFSRPIGSSNINIEGDFTTEIHADSNEYYDIIYSLLKPEFLHGEDQVAGVDILRTAFLSDKILPISKRQIDLLKKIMGLNVSFPIELKRELDFFKKKVNIETEFISKVQQYNKNIQQKIDKSRKIVTNDSIYQEVNQIIAEEFNRLKEEYFSKVMMLNEAEDAWRKSNEFNKVSLAQRLELYNPIFEQLNVYNSLELRDILLSGYNGKEKYLSGSQILVTNLSLYLTFNRHGIDKYHNGIGLLVTDIPNVLDNKLQFKMKESIEELTFKQSLQYVEFAQPYESIGFKQSQIIDLPRGGRFYE